MNSGRRWALAVAGLLTVIGIFSWIGGGITGWWEDRGEQVGLELEVVVPGYLEPAFTVSSCLDGNYTGAIPVGLQPENSLPPTSYGEHLVYWDGVVPFGVLDNFQWLGQGETVKVTIEHIEGHLDDGGLADPATGSHYSSPVTKRRVYRGAANFKYCPPEEIPISQYPCQWVHLCGYLGPNQVWVSLADEAVVEWLQTFERGRVEFLAWEGQKPTIYFNSAFTARTPLLLPDKPYRHMAAFLVTIETVGERR